MRRDSETFSFLICPTNRKEIVDEEKTETIEKIKNHIKRHKLVYSCIATGIGAAGITWLIMRDRHAVVGNAASDRVSNLSVRSLSFNFLTKDSGNVTTVISRDGRGHPGYITRWLEGMVDYETQGLAAQDHGVDSTVMSRHIQGIIPDIDGKHFERVSV
jgi:hypothetical protein